MDTAGLYQGLTFLAWTSVGFLIVVGLFLIKVLFDCSRLLQSMNQTASLIKQSTEPIVSDLKETVSIVNTMVKDTEKNVNSLKKLSGKTTKFILAALSKTSTLSGIVAKGIWSIIKTLIKK